MYANGIERPERAMHRMADSFRALGDPERLRVLHVLHRYGEITDEALAAHSGLSLDRVTEHLRVLGSAGLVRSEPRDGVPAHALDSYGLLDLMATMNAHLDPRTARPSKPRQQRRANGHLVALGGV